MERAGRAKRIEGYELFMAIQEAEHILLVVHVSPDGDAIGSMLGFYEMLTSVHKKVSMVVDDVVPKKFYVLPYAKEIQRPETLKDADTVDLTIVLDASTWERIGNADSIIHSKVINIDHHISNSHYADELYWEPDAAATGEILTMLIKRWNMPMSESMATALYLAISADTGFFKFSNTTSKTLAAAALLVKEGAKTQAVANIMDAVNPARLKALQRATGTISYGYAGTAAMIWMDKETIDLVEGDTDGFVDIARNVEGVELAILVKYVNEHQTKLSLRSQHLDVNALAARFGGGGHIRAAGCTMDVGFADVEAQIWQAVSEQYGKDFNESLVD